MYLHKLKAYYFNISCNIQRIEVYLIMELLRLKQILDAQEMSIKDFSEKVGLSYTYCTELARGDKFPRADVLLKISNVLDVDIKDLFNSTKETETKTIYVLRDGKPVPIGEIKKV